jgi:hypothetical protein
MAIARRLLTRRRMVLTLGLVVAIAAGYKLGHKPVAAGGAAKTRVVVDTPDSSLVTGAPKGGDTLSWRATLLAMQLATDQSQRVLAGKAGVPADQLSVSDSELAGPTVLAPLPTAAAKAADSTAKPYAVSVGTDDTLPIITIQTAAPDRAGAVRLAQAAIGTLQVGASPKDTATLQGLTFSTVGPIDARAVAGGGGKKKMAITAIVVFALWWVCMLIGPAIAGAKRTLREDRALGW